MATPISLARRCEDNCGTLCNANQSCYKNTDPQAPKGYEGNCQCFSNSAPPLSPWVLKRDVMAEMSTDEIYKTRLLQARQAANFTNPTNAACCLGGLSCVNGSACWKRRGITGNIECKCLSGNPNSPVSQGWVRYPPRAEPPTWA